MIASSQMQPEIAQRLSPLEKLVTSDRLTFIPNLYYQQYRLLDILAESRAQYPQQKILVPRQPTSHDYLIQQMRKNHFILEQELKYRKVMCFHIAKQAKQEFFNRKIKIDQKYLFHRIAFSQLSQAVKKKFDQNKSENNQTEKKDQSKQNNRIIIPKPSNDIFMENQQQIDINGMDYDLIGQIFQNPRPQAEQHKQIRQQDLSINDYIKKLTQFDNRSRQCKKMINRRACLKKINQNIRKRIKSKLNQDSGQKSLNSATVLITGLISNQADPKLNQSQNTNVIDPPADTQFLSHLEPKSKKKKQQNFELKWNKQAMQQFQQRNNKFEIGKSKFESNYLTTSIIKDQKQYQKIFHKNIVGKQSFPPTLNSIPNIDQAFKTKYYYNTSSDKQYENFIIRHNKKMKFQKFKEIANFALSDTYSNQNESSNIAKLFLNNDHGITDRVIYKVNHNKIVPVSTIQQKFSLTREELLLLSFLVRKYLCIFGSNWKIITTLVLTHPSFSSMYLNTQQIQQLYQIPKQNNNLSSIQQINLMNKKILPSSIFFNSCYEQMTPSHKLNAIYEQMTDESEQVLAQQPVAIDLANYQNLINQPLAQHETPVQYTFINTAKMYQEFVENTKLPLMHEPTYTLTESLGSIINEFDGKKQIRYLEHKQPAKFNQCSDWVLEKVKNEIKFNTPTRKRKNITDKSSQLVKILQTLKQKVQNPTKQTIQTQRVNTAVVASNVGQANKAPVVNSVTPAAPAPVATTTPQTPAIKKTLPKKLDEKKEKPATKQHNRQRKKKAGKDQKQPQKEPE